jgi:competence protein ComEA
VRWLSKFHLSVTERKGFIVLLTVLFGLVAYRIFIIFWPSQESIKQSTLLQEIDLWREEQRIAMLVPKAFDPNTIADSVIQNFKIPKYAKENWIKFRSRGRKFESKADLLAIYGMDSMWFTVNYDSILLISETPRYADAGKTQKFNFDPNTATLAELVLLGIPEYLAERILKYRQAGGTFKKPEDVQSIYNFPKALYNELRPFIRINLQIEVSKTEEKQKERTIQIINLNKCDSLQLLTLPSIGPTFAGRILKYRKKLGGFFDAEQLLEVYGFDQERLANVSAYLVISGADIQKLAVNKATFKELLAHPYFNYEQVKVLVNYREKIGPIKNISNLSQLEHFSAKDVERLAPYLSVD